MGGKITLIVRETSGDVEAYGSPTGQLPLSLSDPRLFSSHARDVHAWKERFIAPLATMRDDYMQHHETGTFAHPGTALYGEPPGIAPEEYGLILIDFATRSAVSMQTYCYEPAAVSLYSLTPEAIDEPHAKGVLPADSNAEREANLVRLIDSGAVRRMALPQPGDGYTSYTFKTHDISGTQALAKLKRLVSIQPSDKAGFILIEPAGWSFQTLPWNRQGMERALGALDERGIQLQKPEREQWLAFAKARLDMTEFELGSVASRLGLDVPHTGTLRGPMASINAPASPTL